MSESIVNSATSFEELKKNFDEKLDLTKMCIQLRGGWADDTVQELSSCKIEIYRIYEDLSKFKMAIQEGKNQIKIVKNIMQQLDLSTERLIHMKNNLPKHLPCMKQAVTNDKIKLEQEKPKPTKEELTLEKKTSNKAKSPQQRVPKPLPEFQFISIPDFEAVPKYVRGRIQFDQVNKAVTDLNIAIRAKYSLLRRPRSKLSPIEMDMVDTFKKQMNAESKGFHFVTDIDIKKLSQMKLDRVERSILTILRMSKRIQEIRGPQSLVRYCVVPEQKISCM